MPGPTLWSEPRSSTRRPDRFLELVAPKMVLVEEELRRNFTSHIATIQQVGDHILDGGGKRMRPLLLLLSSRMLGYEGTRDVRYAAVVEFIHTATLVHDDIIDDAAVRRGKSSINYKWGNHLTVLVGDYLYTHALQTAVEEGNLDILKLLSGATRQMVEGEILGLEINGRIDLDIDGYFDIVSRKTAALFATAARIPGHLVDLDPALGELLSDYGFNLGVTFQLIDDLLDFTSTTEVLGKPALSDLKEGKVTLPIILALRDADDGERRLIARIASEKSFGPADPDHVLAIVDRCGAIEQTRDIARDYADRARKALAPFPDTPAKEALEFAIDFVMTRIN